jgi:uncharacterized membrane protein (UPF0127 family)
LKLTAALVAAFVAFSAVNTLRADPLLTYPLKVKGHAIRVEVANTPETRRTGLMFRASLPDSQGMLFVYETEDRHAMWMKNTLVPLSVAFIDRGGHIINIEDMQPQTEDTHMAAARAAFSLETNLGWFKQRGIKKGDRVEGLERLPPSQE